MPIYRQMIDQIKHQIAVGVLGQGDKLPSVRELATRLAVNQNTVLKVYNELCREQVLKVERGDGTYVSGALQTLNRSQRKAMVADALRPAVIQAVQLEVSVEQVGKLLTLEYDRIITERSTE